MPNTALLAPVSSAPTSILHLTASYPPDSGGIARYVQLLAEMQSSNHVCVLSSAATAHTWHEQRNGISIIRLARQAVIHSAPTGNLLLGLGPWLHRLAARSDLVHLHLPFPSALGWLAWLPRRIPLVITYHNEIQADLGIPPLVRKLHDWCLQRWLARAAAIIVTTADYAAACPALGPWQAKIHPIPIAIDADRFAAPALADPALVRAPDQLLYVGRLAYYKGLDLLLHAIAPLATVRLIIVGDGPERSALQQLAAHLGLTDRITWRGHVPDAELPRLYCTASALVLPSTGLSESFGIVQLEALACGTPIINSALPGVRIVSPHGLTGLQVPPNDITALRQAISQLLSDAPLRARLGPQAAAHVRQHFSIDRLRTSITACYTAACTPPNKQSTD